MGRGSSTRTTAALASLSPAKTNEDGDHNSYNCHAKTDIRHHIRTVTTMVTFAAIVTTDTSGVADPGILNGGALGSWSV